MARATRPRIHPGPAAHLSWPALASLLGLLVVIGAGLVARRQSGR